MVKNLKKSKIKLDFSVKKKEELKDLSFEELLEYTKTLTDYANDLKKPKKNSNNSSIPASIEIVSPQKKKN